jgi:flagellar hook-basal body complex protein FliE
MTDIPAILPAQAAAAYGQAQSGDFSGTSGAGFGDVLQQAVSGAIDTLHHADAQSTQALSGQGNITDVVTAVQQAELTLQAASAIRDRVVQAYQDIMKMPI